MYGITAAFKRHLTVLYDYERILLGMGGEILTPKARSRSTARKR